MIKKIETLKPWDETENPDLQIKIPKTHKLIVSIDTEFTSAHSVSLQVWVPDLNAKIFIVNSRLVEAYPERLNCYRLLESDAKPFVTHLFYRDLDNLQNNNLHEILKLVHAERGLLMPKNVEVLFFYSYKDLWCAFGFNPDRLLRSSNFRKQDWIQRLRAIKGCLYRDDTTYKLIDIKGIASSNLESLASNLGFEMANKHALDEYKNEKMDLALLSPDDKIRRSFIQYGLEDATVLPKILERFRESLELICIQELGFPIDYLPKNWPATLGACIALIFETYIFVHAVVKNGVPKDTFDKAIFKVGYLGNLNKPRYIVPDKRQMELDRKEIYKKKTEDPTILNRHLKKWNYNFDAISNCSINWVRSHDAKAKNYASSFVSGGRCSNEQPHKLRAENLLDVDIQSCYGSALAAFSYPIGTPELFQVSVNDIGPTLKEFLELYQDELEPGLWTITVSGDLNFSQSLLYSRTLTTDHEDPETVNPGSHVLLHNQIQNGILTQDLLNILNRVCSYQEKKAFYALNVESALFYRASKKCNSVHEWCDKVLQDKVSAKNNLWWYAFPLKEVVQPLIDKRHAVKARMSRETDKEIKSVLNAQQTALKLIVNTTYGVITSHHFRINNLVCANQITGRARGQSWLIGRPLSALQTITDGALFEALSLNALRPGFKKPGLASLSDLEALPNHASIKKAKLLDATWVDPQATNFIGNWSEAELNRLVKEFCEQFWSNYDIEMDFTLELKMEHTAVSCGFYSKAHYYIRTISGDEIFKTRGFTRSETEQEAPLDALLKNFCDERTTNYLPVNRKYIENEHVSATIYLQQIKKNPSFAYLPGDIRLVEREFKLGLKQFVCRDLKDLARVKRFERQNKSLEQSKPEVARDPQLYLSVAQKVVFGESKRGRDSRKA